ncbi:MAG: hypothetical protein IPL27_06460 [Lewinellaceae bacterium]|nr:hypothetical protein [Lewinellaceae bacterium]
MNVNRTDPGVFATGGATEFEITDPVVGLAGSGTADAPYLLIAINTLCWQSIVVQYNVRDLDNSADDAIQSLALQYRVGNSGAFMNVPAAFISDATTANAATLVTPVNVILPPACNNAPVVQLRIMTTNAAGNDEYIGIDDISITGTPLVSAVINGAGNFCFSGNTATAATPLSVTITGGTGPYTIDYTDGLMTNYPAISNYTNGAAISHNITFTTTYTLVSVTDASGCPVALSGSADFFVSESLPSVGMSTQSDPSLPCFGMNGSIQITSTMGGMGPFTATSYAWSTTNGDGIVPANGATQSTLSAGTYTLVITDANGCQSVPTNFTLNEPPGCCPQIEAVMVDACGTEQLNEFIIIGSGAGFNTSDIQLDYNAGANVIGPENNDINIDNGNFPGDPTLCGLIAGNTAAFTGCSNLIAVGPGFDIPANSCSFYKPARGRRTISTILVPCAAPVSAYM